MHIDLERTHSKLRHEADGFGAAPLFQFDRQALGRISTSPTLRRMRSTRRSQTDLYNPATRMESTEEEPGMGQSETPPAPVSPVSPMHRYAMSPLAASPLCDGAIHLDNGASPYPSNGRQRTRSHRSKTLDNGISCTRQESLGAHTSDFQYPSFEGQENEHDHTRLQERRRSSVVVSIPGLDVSPGDLFVSNGSADMLNRSSFSDTKKSKWPFLRRSTTKGKISVSTVSTIEKHLSTAHIQDWRNIKFQKYKGFCLAEFLQDQSPQLKSPPDPQGYKQQEALWELFTSESVYFLDQLMVLKEVSFGFLNNLLRVIKDTREIPVEGGGASLPDMLSKAFQESICHCLQKYCLNYSAALLYLDCLKAREDFGCYLKWCERKDQCRRLQLRDLLVAPLQRLTRYPLLLRNMAKRSPGEEEKGALQAVAEQVDTAICDLEGKVKWLDNYQQVKQLRDALVWLPLWERDKRAFVPESLELEQLLKEGWTFTVVDQPVSLDRLQLKNIDQLNAAASGLPHSFILMHQNRYQQCVGAFILQAPCEAVKKVWMSKIEGAVTALLKLDSQQPRVKRASLWLESSQI
ncbi:hypothetical protein CRUP_001960 [Coryphaenoides rupestris]|nr:hypothetical protein CRUP_001960 [Coryphaenoides rupestris]